MMKFLSLSIVLTAVSCWKFTSHFIISRIAHDILKEEDSFCLWEVEQELKILERSYPTWTEKEGDHPMVECSTFADDVKWKGQSYQSTWHYVNVPLYESRKDRRRYPFEAPEHNVTEAIQGIVDMFRKEGEYWNSYVYQSLMKYGPSGHGPADSYSIALRYLIHYVADVHQPMHSTARINSDYPDGDRGGNDFGVPYKYGASNLHAVWDSVMYEFRTNPKAPFDEPTWEEWGGYASSLVAKHPLDTLNDVTDLDPLSWERESYLVAKKFVYRRINEDEALPDWYVKKGQIIAEKRLVEAGYRLANLLRTLQYVYPIEEPSAPSSEPVFIQP